MNNWLIGCNCNSSFSIPKISIASLCSKAFSGLSWAAISNSPDLWTSFSGLGTAAIYNWFIGCNCNSSFSIPNISIASLCSKAFSGRCSCSITNSPALWTSFSGLVVPAMYNWFIGWIDKGSFSAAVTSMASLCSKTFSGLGVFIISISLVLWTSFSGCSNPAIYKASINCRTIASFSITTISILSLCSTSLAGLSCFWIRTKSFSVDRFSHGCFSPLTKI